LAKRELIEFKVFLDDLALFQGNDKLVEAIEHNTLHYIHVCSDAIDKSLPQIHLQNPAERDTIDQLNTAAGHVCSLINSYLFFLFFLTFSSFSCNFLIFIIFLLLSLELQLFFRSSFSIEESTKRAEAKI
jgi:hypothetical protein